MKTCTVDSLSNNIKALSKVPYHELNHMGDVFINREILADGTGVRCG
jgi:hypothetical protein